jgi:hypothetical protein
MSFVKVKSPENKIHDPELLTQKIKIIYLILCYTSSARPNIVRLGVASELPAPFCNE